MTEEERLINFMVGISFIMMVFIIIYRLINKILNDRNVIKRLEIRRKEVEIMKMEAEIEILKTQKLQLMMMIENTK